MRRSLTSIAFLAAACATPAAKMTFAEAGIEAAGEPSSLEDGPPPSEARPPAAGGSNGEAPAGGLAARRPAARLDPVLVRFAVLERQRRAELTTSPGFAPEATRAWHELTSSLAELGSEEGPPLAELVRARVTLETEFELDRRRFGEPPPGLAQEVALAQSRVAELTLAARALGDSLLRASSPPPPLAWPIADADLTSLFGARVHPIDHVVRMHQGIDLAAAAGRVVHAAAAGYVVEAGPRPGYGLLVEVEHSGGLSSRYAHLAHLLCAAGDFVEAGAPIGLVGATGRATGPHLHFEVWQGGRPMDPLALLVTAGARD
jgi:murein DD-endopeptidase MepM/ murein hydrolase activator NlpD